MTDKKDNHGTPDEAEAFRAAMADVKPLSTDRVVHPPRRPRLKRREDVTHDDHGHDTITDITDITDAAPEDHALGAFDRSLFARPGVQQGVIRRLNRGRFPISGELDLHGMTIREAKPRVAAFLEEMRGAARMCCVRIVHGKGLSSDTTKPVLKNQLDHWLRQLPEVLAFCSARPADGGSGALNVLIRRL